MQDTYLVRFPNKWRSCLHYTCRDRFSSSSPRFRVILLLCGRFSYEKRDSPCKRQPCLPIRLPSVADCTSRLQKETCNLLCKLCPIVVEQVLVTSSFCVNPFSLTSAACGRLICKLLLNAGQESFSKLEIVSVCLKMGFLPLLKDENILKKR